MNALGSSSLGNQRLHYGQYKRKRGDTGSNENHAFCASALKKRDRCCGSNGTRDGRRHGEIAHTLCESLFGNDVCRDRRGGRGAHAPSDSVQHAQPQYDSHYGKDGKRCDGAHHDDRTADEHPPSSEPVEQCAREHAHDGGHDGHERRGKPDDLASGPQLSHVHWQSDVEHLEAEEHGQVDGRKHQEISREDLPQWRIGHERSST